MMNIMNEWWNLLLPLGTGAVLGIVFYGGLRWTVEKSLTAMMAPLLFASSFLVRTAIVGAGFYWVAGSQFWRWIACIAGFLAARIVLLRLYGPLSKESERTKSSRHD